MLLRLALYFSREAPLLKYLVIGSGLNRSERGGLVDARRAVGEIDVGWANEADSLPSP
jgi:hypothetical protein